MPCNVKFVLENGKKKKQQYNFIMKLSTISWNLHLNNDEQSMFACSMVTAIVFLFFFAVLFQTKHDFITLASAESMKIV